MIARAAPPLASLLDYLDQHAAAFPQNEAAVDASGSLTYATLREAVDGAARALSAAGLAPGERVAFLGLPGLGFWVSLLAAMRVGAVWVGLNPQHSERELTHVLVDAQPALVLIGADAGTESRHALQRAASQARLPDPVALGAGSQGVAQGLRSRFRQGTPRAAQADATASELSARGACLIVYTSGTTGQPKGALLGARGLVENGWWMARRLGFEPHRTLANLPVNHVGCIGDVCATTLVLGGTLVFMPRFDAMAAVGALRKQGITWLPQVPAQFQLMLAKGGLDAAALAGVRCLAWGGAAMPRGLIEQLGAWVPDLFTSYGLTECSGTITISRAGAGLDALADTIGEPVQSGRVRIADAGGQPAAPGSGGEIQIHGPHVFLGYLNRPEATRDTFTADGWLRTGDLGAFDADGHVRLLGRTREMFKSGGYNVYPREVESVIESLPGVELCAVVGVPDPLWDEVGVAFVQADPLAVTPELLARHCAEGLARYKLPKRFVVRRALPLLPIGKVDKQALRDLDIGAVP